MQLYLIRHGNSAGDPHRHTAPPVTGYLSATGQQQAARLAAHLSAVRFDTIYASPLGRTVQTAQALADPRQLPIQLVPWLIEWRPAQMMTTDNPANYESLLAAAALRRPETSWKTESGESTFEMANRIVPGWQELLAKHGIHPGHGGYLFDHPTDEQRIALVGHGGSLGVLLAFILGLPLQPYAPLGFRETGIAVIDFVQRVDVWYPLLRLEAAPVE